MRPRDPVTGKLLEPPCKRYERRPFHEIALPLIDADPRSPALPIRRKLEMIDRAMNTVIDGDRPPIWVQRTDPARLDNQFMRDLWGVAVSACRDVLGEQP
jgi:hypothetical protein